MTRERIPMRTIKEVLRLKWAYGQSRRAISKSCGVARSTVDEYTKRAKQAGLSWPLPPDLDDASLENLLYPPVIVSETPRPLPVWEDIHRELARKSVTLMLLWDEYKAQYPDGYQYSHFCDLYRAYAKKLDISMRQVHLAGEKLFVDYCGQTVPVIDKSTGEVHNCQIFVAVLGASNYTYAEATYTQGLPDWIGSHVRALTFLGGVPEILVPDNLLSGVTKPCRYEPGINRSYQELAVHYGAAVIPARVRKPKDKAKVEAGVLLVQRWILAALRNRTFFSLRELNVAIQELLERLNNRPFKKLSGSRRSRFLEIDKPALRPLPAVAFEYAEWIIQKRAGIDYHLEVHDHYYSVPYQLRKEYLDVRVTESIVEVFFHSNRVASHIRSYVKGGYTTVAEHMPKAHRDYAEWTPERLVRWASETGKSTSDLVAAILSKKVHPQQGFRSCLGIITLSKKFGKERVEAACKRALVIGGTSLKSVKSILETGLDKKPLPTPKRPSQTIIHSNIRGREYYN
jgi:transposase